ncbi:MAG: polynucleotide adenylyltransferase PcnB [Acidobacteriota bacterium]
MSSTDHGGGDDQWEEPVEAFGPGDDELPFVLPRPDHPVSRKLISSGSLKVLYRLKKQGYRAYLCGGAVRDLMMGRPPKDFDVATDARPNEIKRAFRNARIIGRRFRLAHILFHDETVEVSTFRRTPDPDEQASAPDELLITNDNTWGSPREDAFRRDFTINALFYDIEDFSVVDYVGGIDDLHQRLVRVIGDPALRFHEDPVRMLRACEFAGRLGFTIERRTQEGIQESCAELLKAAPARLTEELLQLLRCGHAAAAIQWMLDLGVLEVLLPEALAMIEAHQKGAGAFTGILPVLDQLARDGRRLDDPVLLGAVLLPQVMLRRFEYERSTGRWMSNSQFHKAVEDTLRPFQQRFAVAKHKRAMLIHALEGFHRLCGQKWTPSQRVRYASKSYFDDALDLFELLVRATGEGHEALEHWQVAKRQRKRQPEPHVDRKRRRPGGGGRRRRKRR